MSTAWLPLMPIFSQAFVDGSEAAGHLRAIGVGELAGQGDQVLLLGEQVVGHAAVALPAVGAAIAFAGAGDHVAAAAVVAHAAAGDVIDDHAVALAESAAAGPGRRRSARTARGPRSRPGSLPGPCPGARDRCSGYPSRRWWTPSCAAALRRGRARGRARRAFRRCCCRAGRRLSSSDSYCGPQSARPRYGGVISPSEIPRSSQLWSVLPKKDLPLDQAAVAVDGRDLRPFRRLTAVRSPRLSDSPGSARD